MIAQALRALKRAQSSSITPSAVAVQLREKDLGARALVDLGRELRRVTTAAGVRLFVNDRVDVALAIGADGVHLGGGALAPAEVHALSATLQVAVSTHSPAEVQAAAADPRIEFALFGPVFDTPSKRQFGSPQGLDQLRLACAAAIPVLAVGGVQANKIPDCFGVGASGIATVREVLCDRDPAAALGAIFERIEST